MLGISLLHCGKRLSISLNKRWLIFCEKRRWISVNKLLAFVLLPTFSWSRLNIATVTGTLATCHSNSALVLHISGISATLAFFALFWNIAVMSKNQGDWLSVLNYKRTRAYKSIVEMILVAHCQNGYDCLLMFCSEVHVQCSHTLCMVGTTKFASLFLKLGASVKIWVLAPSFAQSTQLTRGISHLQQLGHQNLKLLELLKLNIWHSLWGGWTHLTFCCCIWIIRSCKNIFSRKIV